MEGAVDLGALLDAGEDAVVTLVAGETRLVAHRAVLSDRSPVFGAMFAHDMREASSGEVDIADVEGPALRQLLACLYTLQGPQLIDIDTVTQLLVAADKYGVAGLKTTCEQQLAAQLCVETAASAAVLAVRHCCPSLRQAAVAYIKAHEAEVMATRGWADAVRLQPEDVDEVNKLLAETSRTQPLGRTAGRARRRPRPPPATPPQSLTGESSTMSAVDLGALLDAGEDVLVTLVAGQTRLVAHRAVLVHRSPVFASVYLDDTQESRSGQVNIVDVEGSVLRQLVSYLYTLRAPQLIEIDAVTQLLVAADKYGVAGLKAAWEQQVAAQLSVETAAAAAVLAVRHSCEFLRRASIRFLMQHTRQVMATRGWADAMSSQPDDLKEVNRLLVAKMRRLRAEERSRRLREAAKEGAVGELEALLAAGANVVAVDECRMTALHHAAQGGHVEAARRLLAAGADVAAVDGNTWTALHHAAREGHVEAARLLVARGAPVDARSCGQMTPLHWAVARGHAAVVRLLLAASADHSARAGGEWTPLHCAAYRGNREAAAALLEAGADRGATDNEGKTALDLAREWNWQQLVELLAET